MPKSKLPEFAFIGRSNVGKSSLINYLCHRKNLARTSAKPGKTQLINIFEVDQSWILADLPGYGYAKVSKGKRQQWSQMISSYLIHRPNLYCVFILIDARIPPQKIDLEQIEWMAQKEIPFVIVFTKADNYVKSSQQDHIEGFMTKLEAQWDPLPDYFVTSANKGLGRDSLLEFIGKYVR